MSHCISALTSEQETGQHARPHLDQQEERKQPIIPANPIPIAITSGNRVSIEIEHRDGGTGMLSIGAAIPGLKGQPIDSDRSRQYHQGEEQAQGAWEVCGCLRKLHSCLFPEEEGHERTTIVPESYARCRTHLSRTPLVVNQWTGYAASLPPLCEHITQNALRASRTGVHTPVVRSLFG